MSAVSLGGWKRGSDSLEQAVQGAASHGMQALGIGPGFFARAVHALPSHLLRLLAWGKFPCSLKASCFSQCQGPLWPDACFLLILQEAIPQHLLWCRKSERQKKRA